MKDGIIATILEKLSERHWQDAILSFFLDPIGKTKPDEIWNS